MICKPNTNLVLIQIPNKMVYAYIYATEIMTHESWLPSCNIRAFGSQNYQTPALAPSVSGHPNGIMKKQNLGATPGLN